MHAPAVAFALVLIGAVAAGCSEVEESSSGGYEPAHLEHVAGSDLTRVTFTQEGSDRTGLELAPVRNQGRFRTVPYESLIYDGDGRSWVYTTTEPQTFVRAQVDVKRVEGSTVLLASGPPVGTDVVTVGASEVYGAELDIAGGH